MNRSQYLEGLAQSLAFLSDENRSAAVSFYAEMLDDRIEEGVSEEDAVEKMESIEAIAARFRAEYDAPVVKEAKLVIEEKPARESIVVTVSDDDDEDDDDDDDDDDDEDDDDDDDDDDEDDDTAEEIKDRISELQERLAEREERRREKEERRAERQAEREARQTEKEARRAEREASWEERAERFERDHMTADIEASVLDTVRAAGEVAQSAAREAIAAAKEALQDIKIETRSAGQNVEKPVEPVLKTVKAPADTVRTITVRASNDGVKIEKSETGEASVTYYTDEFTLYETSFENGNLMVKRLSNSILDGNQMFRLFKHGFVYHRSNPDIVVKVPQDSLIDIDIVTSNGRISLSALRGLGSVYMKSSNGSLTCDTASMLALTMKSSNGKIDLKGVHVKHAIDAKSSNSHLEAQSVFGGEDVALGTTNSRLNASVIKAGGTLTLTSTNGGLYVEKLLARAYRLRTSNANIAGTLPGNASIYRISSGTSNGKNSLPAHQNGDIPLEVFTSNGSIRLTFEDG